MADWIPVVPARGGAEAALGLYYTIKFFSSIELARAVRQPGPCVLIFRNCCAAVQEHDCIETIQAAPAAHRKYLSSPAAATLYTEKHKVSCSGFVPKTKCTQHSCSHYNAICIHTWQTPKENRLRVETIQAAPTAHRRYLSSPAAATWHGKTQGFVLRLPPQNKAHAAIPIRFATTRTHPFITMRFASTRGRTPRENRYKVMMANW